MLRIKSDSFDDFLRSHIFNMSQKHEKKVVHLEEIFFFKIKVIC